MTGRRAWGIAIALGICGTAFSAEESKPQGPAAGKLPAGYEILSPDARWCGPRILYFFSCYYGMDRTLEEVVELCGTDEAGSTSLADLVCAARALGLEPIPVESSLDEVLDRFTGHAVLLKASSPGLVWPSWLGRFERGVLVLLVLTVCSVVLAKRLSMRRAKRKEGRS